MRKRGTGGSGGQPVRPPAGEERHGVRSADQYRGDGQNDFIDQALVKEPGRRAAPAFDKKGGDFPRSEVGKNTPQIQPRSFAGKLGHLGSASKKAGLAGLPIPVSGPGIQQHRPARRILKQPGFRRSPEAGIEDDPQDGLAPSSRRPDGQARIVVPNRLGSDQNRVVFGPEEMGVAPGLERRDPGGFPCPGGQLAVEAEGGFQGDEGPPVDDVPGVGFIEPGFPLRAAGDVHGEARRPQEPYAPAADDGIGIETSDDGPDDSGRQDGFGAGGRPSPVNARLQGEIKSRPARVFPGPPESGGFGVLPPGRFVEAGPDDPPAADDDRSDMGIRGRAAERLDGQGLGHVQVGEIALVDHDIRASTKAAGSKSSISSAPSPVPTRRMGRLYSSAIASTAPPRAVPSSLVKTNPLRPAHLRNSRA